MSKLPPLFEGFYRVTAKGQILKDFHETYKVQRYVQTGGFGHLYAGTRIRDSKQVALKYINKANAPKITDKETKRVKSLEVVLLEQVAHIRSCIELFDNYENDDSYLIVMEWPEGAIDLFDYIYDKKKLNENEARQIFHDVVETVIAIHASGIVHRDLKDENILIIPTTGQVKLIDFGAGTFLHDGIYTDFIGLFPSQTHTFHCIYIKFVYILQFITFCFEYNRNIGV